MVLPFKAVWRRYNKFINVQVEEMVVFLHRTEPDLEFEGLLKRRHTQIKYLSVAFASTFDLKQFSLNL